MSISDWEADAPIPERRPSIAEDKQYQRYGYVVHTLYNHRRFARKFLGNLLIFATCPTITLGWLYFVDLHQGPYTEIARSIVIVFMGSFILTAICLIKTVQFGFEASSKLQPDPSGRVQYPLYARCLAITGWGAFYTTCAAMIWLFHIAYLAGSTSEIVIEIHEDGGALPMNIFAIMITLIICRHMARGYIPVTPPEPRIGE